MEVKCKTCGRIYNVEKKKFEKVRPSSYLCPSCRDKGGKAGAGLGGILLLVGSLLRLIVKKK